MSIIWLSKYGKVNDLDPYVPSTEIKIIVGTKPKTTIIPSTTESTIRSTADAGGTISTNESSAISMDDEELSLVGRLSSSCLPYE